MAQHTVLLAQSHDVTVSRWMILRLVSGQQCLAAEGFDSNKNFKAAGASKQTYQFFLFCDLRVALNKERNLNFLFNHLLEQILGFPVFVEIVGGEHHHPNTGSFGVPQALHRCFQRLASHLPAGNLDDGAKVTSKWTPASRIYAEHRNNVAPQIPLRRWN